MLAEVEAIVGSEEGAATHVMEAASGTGIAPELGVEAGIAEAEVQAGDAVEVGKDHWNLPYPSQCRDSMIRTLMALVVVLVFLCWLM